MRLFHTWSQAAARFDDANLVSCAGLVPVMTLAEQAGLMFDDVYAPSTLGSFLRAFTHGHTLQLAAAARRLLINLAERTPMLDGADQLTFVDIDSLLRRVYGKKKRPRPEALPELQPGRHRFGSRFHQREVLPPRGDHELAT